MKLDRKDWIGGIVPCCGNCRNLQGDLLQGWQCVAEELPLGSVSDGDLCEQHDPLPGVAIKHIDEDRITAECSAFVEQEESRERIPLASEGAGV